MSNRTCACGQSEEHTTLYEGGSSFTGEKHGYEQCTFTMRRGGPLTYRLVRTADGTPVSDWVKPK